ncbi:uncharacterized protein M437DRAFT_53944 [Aureobasidium melanogenum CBS 110374]|uniref:C3H1-type domain-containing protein n=1 Tax=Aureobasidium melanogenum (strain CBS 110374) TaxID=1043003 RepID=A0A074WE92_AURM1|nr:uncharacterized protein M437DRAFT_53944 [Aureobasidium melanogenum CBS 110374]KEQ60801.1 hypothetical protein M437DRAFT_53944 [Aureobasidium melanogenum CBS 110374]
MFNERTTELTESPRKSPMSRSTTVPKRARVNDQPSEKEATKQPSGTTTSVVTSRPKSFNTSSVHKKSQPGDATSEVAAAKDKGPGRPHKDAGDSSSTSQASKLVKSSTARNLSTVPGNLEQRRASDATSTTVPSESRKFPERRDAASTATTETYAEVPRNSTSLLPRNPAGATVTNDTSKPAPKAAGPSRRAPPIKLFHEPKVKPRQRPRVNEYTPKDSTDPQFVNLSTQRRMHLYSHNEPAPDPNALNFIDPNTGKVLNPPSGPSSTSNALRLDINVTRRENLEGSAAPKSASALERRSASTSGYQREPLHVRIPAPHTAQASEQRFAYPLAQPDAPRFSRKHLTCRFWYRGTCNKSEEECYCAHTWTGLLEPKKAATCAYWENNQCKFTDEQCEYVHGYNFQRNVDVSTRESHEDVNGFRARRRSDSPDRYGLRQDEAEGRRDRTSLPNPRLRPDERTPIQSPSLASTASFEPRNGAAKEVHMKDAEVQGLTEELPINTATNFDVSNEKDTSDPVSISLSIRPTKPPAHTMNIKLVFDERVSRVKFLETICENSSLEGSEICRSRDFEAYWYLKDNTWASGGVICAPGDALATYLEDFLVLHSSCIALRTDDFIFVIYPTQNPDWKFMPYRGPERPGLRWYLQAAVPGTSEPIIVRQTKASFISMCSEHLDLNPEVLFAANRGKHIEKFVYLCFPKGTPETKLVEVFLNEVGAKFVHSEDCDLWSQFCGKGSTVNRVVLFHPSMNFFWKLPDFWSVLATGVNIFQVGVSKAIRNRADLPAKYNCMRLFPSGTLTLITDEIFKYHPAQALQVLEIFEGYKAKPEGGRNDRIYCRPGILAWLAELIDEDREKGTNDTSPRVKCWQLVCELLGTPVADNSRNPFRSDVRPPSMLYSPPKIEMPEYASTWDSSEQEATEFLVNWFAGSAVEECETYRRFNVLYEQNDTSVAQTPGVMQPDNPKDPKEWMKKYTHIRVTTPARYIVQVESYEKSKMRAR